MKITRYSDPMVFELLTPQWDALLDPQSSTNLFLQRGWLALWWKHKGSGDLQVLAVHDEDGALRGIAPWYIDGIQERVVRLLGCTDIVDYLDMIIQPGYERPVIEAALSYMLSPEAPAWDRFNLCNIPQESSTLRIMPQVAESCGYAVEVQVEEVCPVIALPDSYENYLESIDKKNRHELRRKRRRAEAEGVSWYMAGAEHELDQQIAIFLDLMARSTLEKADFLQQPGHREFFIESGRYMAEQGLLDLIVLSVEGEPAAAMWQFAYRERLLLYNSGLEPTKFAHLSPGIVLLTYSIENAIERGFKVYDFLRGNEEYKFRLGAKATEIHSIVMARGA